MTYHVKLFYVMNIDISMYQYQYIVQALIYNTRERFCFTMGESEATCSTPSTAIMMMSSCTLVAIYSYCSSLL